jgi:hypothetical protein
VRRLLSGIVLEHSDNGHGHGGHHEASHKKHKKHGHKAHHQADVTMAVMEVCASVDQTAAVCVCTYVSEQPALPIANAVHCIVPFYESMLFHENKKYDCCNKACA